MTDHNKQLVSSNYPSSDQMLKKVYAKIKKFSVFKTEYANWEDDFKCDKCFIEMFADPTVPEVEIYNSSGDRLGSIYLHDEKQYNDAVADLQQGVCPICEGWEDGLGNICKIEGWGENNDNE